MQQIIQDINSGDLALKTVPTPALQPGSVRIRSAASLISAGTEKMMIDLGEKSMLGKAKARPDLVNKVLAKARKEGWWKTFQAVRAKMDEPRALGYSAAGIVESVGSSISNLTVGDRVAIAGAGYANHAEINTVPKNLVARIPDGVSFEEAAYTTVASIALQGIRLADPRLGEQVAVIGLGLIGLLTVQMLKANGCRVIGVDLDKRKVDLALAMGMDQGVVSSEENAEALVERFTNGRGVDLTLITAATKSSDPIELAGTITRRKGQVVAVGAVGMDVPRNVYYEKELSLQISMSYGPGRYDPSYEEGGIDYPYDYVRWTEQRNMEAVLDLMAQGKIDVESITTHRFKFEDALDAYDLIQNGNEPYIGILLNYDIDKEQPTVIRTGEISAHSAGQTLRVGCIGAGNYATRFLLPHLEKNDLVQLGGLVTATGLSAEKKATKFGFEYCTTDADVLFDDNSIDAIVIATRHSTHAEFTVQALNAGKHVFVEKPMVVSEEQLGDVVEAYERANVQKPTGVMVGLNRRFAPMVQSLREVFSPSTPLQMIYRVNSGPIATDSWLHRPAEGGGMLVGEMVHFVDLMQCICGARPVKVYAKSMTVGTTRLADHDNVSLVITFDDGSTGTLCYNTVGDGTASKERLEVYGDGAVAVLNDFRRLEITREGSTRREKAWNQDKGQAKQMTQTMESFRTNGVGAIPFNELVAGMQVIFAAQKSLREGTSIDVPLYQLQAGGT